MELPKLTIPKPKLNPLSVLSKFKFQLTKVIGRLNISQTLFLIATLMLMFADDWTVACLLIMLALALEFWPKFILLWHTLPGKGLLLFFYAIMANFALANAATVINEITGVSAAQLPYSHNFAILLYLPLWLIGFTIIALLLLQMFLPFYLFVLLVLKPFGLRAVKLISNISYPITTGIFRMVLAAIVLVQLFVFFKSEIEQAGNDFDIEMGLTVNDQSGEKKELSSTLASRKQQYKNFVILSLNQFVYEMEAAKYSRCAISENSRVIELNDYEILEISKDPDHMEKFIYQVKKCVSPGHIQ